MTDSLSFSKKSSSSFFLGLSLLEESIGHRSGHSDLGHVDSRLGGDDVRMGHAAKRHAVDLVRPGDEEKTRFHLLEEHHTLALEVAGEEDEDSSWRDRGAELRLPAVVVVVAEFAFHILGRIIAGLLLGLLGDRLLGILPELGALHAGIALNHTVVSSVAHPH